MAQFPANPQRRDPYKNFKFRLRWDGKYVAGANKVSGLKRTSVIKRREGGDSDTGRQSPGRTEFEPIVLEDGVTDDPSFEQWANLAQKSEATTKGSAANLRKDMTLESLNERGQVTDAYRIYGGWPSKWQGTPMNGTSNEVAIEQIQIENEGLEIITPEAEPKEPGR